MKAIVLSSGGIDSTTCISLAVEKYGAENVVTLSIFYGQKHNKELVCAQKTASYYKLKHYEFNRSMSDAIRIGTYDKVTVEAPFVHMHKADIIAEGLRLQTPYHLTWSCYEGSDTPCGACGTCIDRAKAFAANGVKDPALHT